MRFNDTISRKNRKNRTQTTICAFGTLRKQNCWLSIIFRKSLRLVNVCVFLLSLELFAVRLSLTVDRCLKSFFAFTLPFGNDNRARYPCVAHDEYYLGEHHVYEIKLTSSTIRDRKTPTFQTFKSYDWSTETGSYVSGTDRAYFA